jgi:hypothetical protein
MAYRERVYRFGSHKELVGVLTEPIGDSTDTMESPPAIIVSNVGLNHRVGPNRMWVEFARRMAEKGFVTLRFDVSGLGDSPARRDTQADAERHKVDMREAIEFVLKKPQLLQVALIGLCSGVDPIYSVAVEDPRVSHVFFLDGYYYDTWRHRLNIKLFKFFQPRFYARGLRRYALNIPVIRRSEEEDVFVRDFPSPQRMRQDIDIMLSRGTQLLFSFTGGFAHYYSYNDQFYDMLPDGQSLRGRVQLKMFPCADHLFGGVELKESLYASIESFLVPSSQSAV